MPEDRQDVELAATTPAHAGARAWVEPDAGDEVGRYQLIERLGAGGMGVVWAARDPELNRNVALKLVRPRIGDSRGRARLQREAQAMAKLSHPGVVPVFDAGTAGDQVFVAMELVEGQTLGRWMREQRPRWPEALARFVRAGRGLAAAHAVGIVHRDFKPDNVLVGRDGTVRVTDFGLARLGDDPAADAEGGATPGSPATETLTQSGAIMGTPAYMAPEQHLGRPADARSDQFSYCVALWEAIYGERPFAAVDAQGVPSAIALAAEVTAGRLRAPPARPGVPSAIRRALERGLATQPADRWPTMTALLDALEAVPRRRKRIAVLAAGALVVAGGAAALMVLWPDPRPAEEPAAVSCAGADARIAEVWSPAARERMAAAFTAAERASAVAPASVALDEYAASWARMRVDACEATHVRGEQSPALLDLRVACLDRRRAELDALLGLLATADSGLADRSVSAVQKLQPIDDCAQAAALSGRLAPDPAQAERVRALEPRVAQLSALFAAGRYADGLTAGRELITAARAIAHPPLLADALLLLGKHARYRDEFDAAEAALTEAVRMGGAGRDDAIVIDSLVELARLAATNRSDYQEGWHLAVAAEATLARVGGSELRRGEVHAIVGDIHYYRGEFEESRRAYEAALAAYRRATGPRSVKAASMLSELGSVARKQGRFDDGLALTGQAHEILVAAQGAEHPNVASILNNLGIAAMEAGRYEVALGHYRRSLTLKEKLLGADHTSVASTLHNIGNVLFELGRYREAESHYERTLAIRERAVPDSAFLTNTLDSLGDVRRKQGRLADASALYERAQRIKVKLYGAEHPELAASMSRLADVASDRRAFAQAMAGRQAALTMTRKILGDQHPEVARALVGLADVALARGDCAAAGSFADEALAIAEKTWGEAHPMLILVLQAAAPAALCADRPADARTHAERALALAASGAGADMRGLLRFVLARALWALGEQPAALAAAQQAQADLAAAELPDRKQTRALKAWLASHRR